MKKATLAFSVFALLMASTALAASAPPSMTTEIEEHAEDAQDALSTETGDAQELSPAPITEEEEPEAEEVAPQPKPQPQAQPAPAQQQPRMLTAPAPLMPSRPEADKEPEKKRDSWYIGFGFGGAAGSVKSDGKWKSHSDHLGLEKESSGLAAENLEVGGTINEHLLIGGRLASATWHGGKKWGDATISQIAIYVSANWFPFNGGRGLFLRGGLGSASMGVTTPPEYAVTSDGALDGEQPFTTGDEKTFTGVAGTFGVGYAFWLGESFNLTLNVDAHYGSFNGKEEKGEPTEGWYNSGTLGFMWY